MYAMSFDVCLNIDLGTFENTVFQTVRILYRKKSATQPHFL